MSAGPATPLGKVKVSSNGVVHGLRSERIVLAHEDPAAYVEHVQTWIGTLAPADEAELEIAISIADLRWRLRRMDAVEMNRQRAEVLTQVEETPEYGFLGMVENVATATRVMADTIVTVSPPNGDALQGLLGAVRQVIEMVQAVESERVGTHLGSAALIEAVSFLAILSSRGELDPASLDDLRKAARASAEATERLLIEAREALEKVKEKLAATVPLPDGRQQALLTRYRKDVERRLAAEIAFLTAVRERKIQAQATSGSLGQPIPVSIRLVS
jgi:hypothetical protein